MGKSSHVILKAAVLIKLRSRNFGLRTTTFIYIEVEIRCEDPNLSLEHAVKPDLDNLLQLVQLLQSQSLDILFPHLPARIPDTDHGRKHEKHDHQSEAKPCPQQPRKARKDAVTAKKVSLSTFACCCCSQIPCSYRWSGRCSPAETDEFAVLQSVGFEGRKYAVIAYDFWDRVIRKSSQQIYYDLPDVCSTDLSSEMIGYLRMKRWQLVAWFSSIVAPVMVPWNYTLHASQKLLEHGIRRNGMDYRNINSFFSTTET